MYYVRNADGSISQTNSTLAWSMGMENNRVILTSIQLRNGKKLDISTVFLGLDHSNILGGPPLLFETMVFTEDREETHTQRYATEDEAMKGHTAILKDFVGEWPPRREWSGSAEQLAIIEEEIPTCYYLTNRDGHPVIVKITSNDGELLEDVGIEAETERLKGVLREAIREAGAQESPLPSLEDCDPLRGVRAALEYLRGIGVYLDDVWPAEMPYGDDMPGMTLAEFQEWSDDLIREVTDRTDTEKP